MAKTLTLYPTSPQARDFYMRSITSHRPSDSGFDLAPRENYNIFDIPKILSLGVRAVVTTPDGRRHPTFLVPRSSFAKTGLIMPNSPGVIDSGYNGELRAMVYNFHKPNDGIAVPAWERLFQLISPDAEPFAQIVLAAEGELPSTTERGDGGFGSTGM